MTNSIWLLKALSAGALGALLLSGGSLAGLAPQGDRSSPPVVITAQQDHQRMMDLLHITSLREGRNGFDLHAPNAPNYDESKANPYPNLPDPLVLNNGRRVKNASGWWQGRRAEIVEAFDREIYGRVPAVVPGVVWEVKNTSKEMKGDVPVVVKQLIGHVNNSSYPAITVDIQLTLTTPAQATASVPVVMELTFVFPPGFRPPGPVSNAPPGPTWQ